MRNVGELALESFSRGEVELCQRRIKESIGNKPGAFEYIAINRRVVQPPRVPAARPQGRVNGWMYPRRGLLVVALAGDESGGSNENCNRALASSAAGGVPRS